MEMLTLKTSPCRQPEADKNSHSEDLPLKTHKTPGVPSVLLPRGRGMRARSTPLLPKHPVHTLSSHHGHPLHPKVPLCLQKCLFSQDFPPSNLKSSQITPHTHTSLPSPMPCISGTAVALALSEEHCISCCICIEWAQSWRSRIISIMTFKL